MTSTHTPAIHERRDGYGSGPRPPRTGATIWPAELPRAGEINTAEGAIAPLRDDSNLMPIPGDEIRAFLSSELGFGKDDRNRDVHRIGCVAGQPTRHGVKVATAHLLLAGQGLA